MISISEALRIVKAQAVRLEPKSIGLDAAVGRVLAQDIAADMDMPPFDRSQMDGFAVRKADVSDAPAKLKIVGESVAGTGWHNTLREGEAVRIMTGAAVPDGADSVQKVELTDESDGIVTILKPTKTNQNIVKRSEEITSGDQIFKKGEIITENMIAALASFGYARVLVSRRPRVAILATGSEIVNISEKPSLDQIRNSNSSMLKAFAESAGADVEILTNAEDDLEHLKESISSATDRCDCLIISGGVSVGDYDFTKPALRENGAEIFFEKISLKPGKPTVFAKKGNTLIFGLPGNPVSAAVTFFVFVRMALLLMQSAHKYALKRGFAVLSHPINGAKGRDSLLPVSLKTTKKARLKIETLRFSGSSNFIAFSKASGLVFIPADSTLDKGDIAEIMFLP
ncbi:MAG: molybdopterin molybdotransferase MoeA [Pyrinomonadaceae bacterium]|nr:molybdopterin molybdotransferase MoeA [Pyrinomonadaceae bacterium]